MQANIIKYFFVVSFMMIALDVFWAIKKKSFNSQLELS